MKKHAIMSTIILSVLFAGCLSQEQGGSDDAAGDAQEGIQEHQRERMQEGVEDMPQGREDMPQGREDRPQRQGDDLQRPQDRGGFGNRTDFGNRTGMALPQQALDVCEGGSDGDECQFTLNDESVNGTCRSRQGGEMTCMPAFNRQGERPRIGGNRQI